MKLARRIILAVVLTLLPSLVAAHGGGLDANGGHRSRATGTYHFHRGPLAGQSYSSKTEALAALGGSPAQISEAPSSAHASPTALAAADRLERLIRLLVRKGLITEEEIAAAVELPGVLDPLAEGPDTESPEPAESLTLTPSVTAPAYSPPAPASSSKGVSVRGYYRKDGTYVRPHTRSRPKK